MSISVPSHLRAIVDRVSASDPGFVGLITAAEVVAGVGVAIALAYGYEQTTHALWVGVSHPTPDALLRARQQHHGITVLAMLMGGFVAMFSWIAPRERTWREQAVTVSLLPLAMIVGIAAGIATAPHRAVELAVLVLVAGCGAAARVFVPRFGTRAVLYGNNALLVGYILGMVGGFKFGDLPAIAAILWLTAAVTLILRGLDYRLIAPSTVARMTRAFVSRVRLLAGAAATLLEAPDLTSRRSAQRRLVRAVAQCDETALVIDGQLVEQAVTPGSGAAWALHRDVFDLELAGQTISEASQMLASEVDRPIRAEAVAMLTAFSRGDDTRASGLAGAITDAVGSGDSPTSRPRSVVRALAAAVLDAMRITTSLPKPTPRGDLGDGQPFQSPVQLAGGRLAGSTPAAAATAAARKTRLPLSPTARSAVQVMAAVAGACLAGSALSSSRFYWAVIAVTVALLGVNTVGEQLTRASARLIGTFVGILVGSLIASAIGHSTWSLAVILLALGLGLYLMPVSYTLFVAGTTIVIAELYEQIVSNPDALLSLRLEETGIGVGIAALAAFLVFPVSTDRAVRAALASWAEALDDQVRAICRAVLRSASDSEELRGTQRALDDRFQQLLATARPLRLDPLQPRGALRRMVSLAETAGYWARFVGSQVQRPRAVEDLAADPQDLLAGLERTVERLREPARVPRNVTGDLDLHAQIIDADGQLSRRGVPSSNPGRRALRGVVRLHQTVVELADVRDMALITSHRSPEAARAVT